MSKESIFDALPDIIPRGEILVEEDIKLETSPFIDGPEPQLEYTLNKAPVNKVEGISAQVNGRETTLEKGVDYIVTPDMERIDFDVGGERPDNESTFTVTYLADSIISRYVEEMDKLFTSTEQNIDDSITAHHIDKASGDELDKIGSFFGDLGNRVRRNDRQYRTYLKSIVQSFSGRGTLQGVKFAVSSGLGEAVGEDDIVIEEDFEDNEYRIQIDNFGDLEGIDLATVNELAELADPSGVALRLINFSFNAEISELVATEDVSTTIEEVLAASANHGRDQIDVTADGTTEVIGDDPDSFESTDEQGQDEETAYRTDELAVSNYEEAKHQIDTIQLLGASLEADSLDEFVTDDREYHRTDEVLIASYGHGLTQISVSDDGATGVEWNTPEGFASESDGVSDDTQSQSVEQVQTAYANEGRGQIDVTATN